jgi:DNA-binding winged helix-turn-helix (wHTH) protein
MVDRRLQVQDLVFDASTRQLWVAGAEIHVSPKAFDLLARLIERRPQVVSKAELHECLWPGVHVSESSLPSIVSELRVAIRDRRRAASLIRTVHGHGYAFRGSAASIDGPATSAEAGWLVTPTEQIALQIGENVVGREGDGVILLGSSTVSRRHARLTIDARTTTLEDLHSKNGTCVNDRLVKAPTRIADGDMVRFGSLEFRFQRSLSNNSTQSISSRQIVKGRRSS